MLIRYCTKSRENESNSMILEDRLYKMTFEYPSDSMKFHGIPFWNFKPEISLNLEFDGKRVLLDNYYRHDRRECIWGAKLYRMG